MYKVFPLNLIYDDTFIMFVACVYNLTNKKIKILIYSQSKTSRECSTLLYRPNIQYYDLRLKMEELFKWISETCACRIPNTPLITSIDGACNESTYISLGEVLVWEFDVRFLAHHHHYQCLPILAGLGLVDASLVLL